MKPVRTGVIVHDSERLILRPSAVPFRRRGLIRLTLGCAAFAVLAAVIAAYVFRPHVTYGRAAIAALAIALLYGWRFSTQTTFIALRSSDGIYVETRNRVLRTKRRKLLHAYAQIDAVHVRSRLHTTGAVHYDVLIEKQGTSSLFWYTRYAESAVQIATVIAAFANVPVVNPENV